MNNFLAIAFLHFIQDKLFWVTVKTKCHSLRIELLLLCLHSFSDQLFKFDILPNWLKYKTYPINKNKHWPFLFIYLFYVFIKHHNTHVYICVWYMQCVRSWYVGLCAYLFIYIYIYIYICHPQTDCFVLSELSHSIYIKYECVSVSSMIKLHDITQTNYLFYSKIFI